MIASSVTTGLSFDPDLLARDDFWTILDATDVPTLPDRIEEEYTLGRCLYQDEAAVEYRNCAPYLARLDQRLYLWIKDGLASEPWGIALICPGDLDAVADHFRRFTFVTDPEGEKIFFRYFDPRVLPTFLRLADPTRRAEFFGPVDEFWIPTRGVEVFDRYLREAPGESQDEEESGR